MTTLAYCNYTDQFGWTCFCPECWIGPSGFALDCDAEMKFLNGDVMTCDNCKKEIRDRF